MGRDMRQPKLRFVDVQRARNGARIHHYFRRAGRRWQLPGEPGSPEYMTAYARLLAETEPSKSQ